MIGRLRREFYSGVDHAVRRLVQGLHVDRDVATGHVAAGILGRVAADGPLEDAAFLIKAATEAVGQLSARCIRVRWDEAYAATGQPRFDTFVHCVETGLPALPSDVAEDTLRVANGIIGSPDVDFTGIPAGRSFAMASSFGLKARLLYGAAAVLGPRRCLEIGTAWGMSGLVLLHALKRGGRAGTLDTIEMDAQRHAAAARMLGERFGDRVTCHLGLTENLLPGVAERMGGIDFAFHDGGHGRKHYVGDFAIIAALMPAGGVVVFDDIRWQSRRSVEPSDCYEGWLEVARHPRVRCAVEIARRIGVVALG